MMIARHEETQAHLYGYCDCPQADTGITASEIARMDDAADAEIDANDGFTAESPHRAATRRLSNEEIARRRRARRRF